MMLDLLASFLEWAAVKNYSPRTVEIRRSALLLFIGWCGDRGLAHPRAVSKQILERYQRHLFHYRKQNGQPLSFRSQYSQLCSIRAWFKWLTQQNFILSNPASELELPRRTKVLPRHVLTAAEVELVLAGAEPQTPFGIRDRALLEALYSTGMRRRELAGLCIYDVDHDRGTVLIRQGKGKKDRVIPIGDRALAWLAKYRDQVRHLLVTPGMDPQEGSAPGLSGGTGGTLFLTHLGGPFTPNGLSNLVRRYIRQAELPSGKQGSCHLLRHSMATLMLEGGADIRYIQAMLGHADLSTTQIYTQVSIRKLKEVHSRTHPARLHRPEQPTGAQSEDPRSSDQPEPCEPHDAVQEPSANAAADPQAQELAASPG